MKADWAQLATLAASQRDAAMAKLAAARKVRIEFEAKVSGIEAEIRHQRETVNIDLSPGLQSYILWARNRQMVIQTEIAQIRAQETALSAALAKATGKAEVLDEIRKRAYFDAIKRRGRRHAS